MSRAVSPLPVRGLGLASLRMGRRGRFTAALLATAAVAIALAFALRPSLGPGGPGAPQSLGGSTRVGKVSVSIPRGFYVYTQRGGVGYVLTNYRVPSSDIHDNWVDVLSGNGPPPNGVALRLNKDSLNDPWTPRLQLPLKLNQTWYRTRAVNWAAAAHGGGFVFDNQAYYVLYWIGPAAPANDRAAVLQALRSIRPTR